jgi:hypothetical protein
MKDQMGGICSMCERNVKFIHDIRGAGYGLEGPGFES